MYKIFRLKNGLKVITVPVLGTETVTVLIMFGTGSKYETKENNGISHFLEHMFFKGTLNRPTALSIASELDAIGGEYNAYTSKEMTTYYIKVSADKINIAIDVLGDMILNSKFDENEIEKEKGVIIEEINMYEDNPMMHLEDVFEKCLYGDQPAGWETIGTKENIKKFNRRDFIKYYKSQYSSEHAVICVAGKIDKNLLQIIKKTFISLKRNKFKNKFKVIEKQIKPQVLIFNKKTDQAHIALGVRSYPLGHKDEVVLKVLAVLLGGSMSSRLFINLRERNGLAYYVRANSEIYTDSGYLNVQAGVPLNKIEESLKIIMGEFNKLKIEKVSIEELKKVKDYIKGKTMLAMELSDNNASWFARQITLRGKILTVEEYLKKIEKVNVLDINRVAQDIFIESKLNLAIIGPYNDNKYFEKFLYFK